MENKQLRRSRKASLISVRKSQKEVKKRNGEQAITQKPGSSADLRKEIAKRGEEA